MVHLVKEQLVAAGASEADAATAAAMEYPRGMVGHLDTQTDGDDELVLAYDATVPLVVRGGQVLALDGTQRLVNSTVTAFLRVLARYGRYVNEVSRVTGDEDGERLAIEAAEDMHKIDPPAFDSDALYWPIVCAQMIEGNL